MTVALNQEQTIRVAIPKWALVVKFLIDYVVAALVLVFPTIPLIIIDAVYFAFHRGGSPIVVEQRVGKNEKVFSFYKLRIRTVSGEKTAFGEWLRHWGLDETPQVLCFFRRTMTLVGPRPHWVSEHEENRLLDPQWWERNHVLPGLLGLGIGAITNKEAKGLANKRLRRLVFDLQYIGQWTILIELLCYLYCLKDIGTGHEPK